MESKLPERSPLTSHAFATLLEFPLCKRGFNEWVDSRSHAAAERKTLPELSANMETGFHGMLPERRVSFQRRSHEEKAEEKGYAKSQRGACNQR